MHARCIIDSLGNWTAYTVTTPSTTTPQTRTHNEANEMTAINSTGTNLAHDAAGNMTKIPLTADPTAGHFTCTYDAWNRQTSVTDSTGTTRGRYFYDGLNHRIAKAALNATGTSYDRTDYYYNEGWQCLEERRTPGVSLATATSGVATTPYAQYVWDGRYMHSPACRFRDADADPGNGLEERLFYCNDANFNVTALVDAANGNVVERYMYDPYGQPTICDASWSQRPSNTSAYANEILFTGHRYDPETGLYSTPYRPYGPTIGRWPTRDPIGYADGKNLYAYVRSDPLNRRDPLGKKATVNLWMQGIGHSTLTIGDGEGADAQGLPLNCVSVWPTSRVDLGDATKDFLKKDKDDANQDARTSTYGRDVASEDDRQPDEKIEIDCLDEDAMRAEWAKMKSEISATTYKFHLIGNNCASAVARVLWAGVKAPPKCADWYYPELIKEFRPAGRGELPGMDRKTNLKSFGEKLKAVKCVVYECNCRPLRYISERVTDQVQYEMWRFQQGLIVEQMWQRNFPLPR